MGLFPDRRFPLVQYVEWPYPSVWTLLSRAIRWWTPNCYGWFVVVLCVLLPGGGERVDVVGLFVYFYFFFLSLLRRDLCVAILHWDGAHRRGRA